MIRSYAADPGGARAKLATNTDFAEDGSAQLITVMVTDRNAQRAAEMCNAYAEELNIIITGFAISAARKQRIFLYGRLDAAKHLLKSSERDLAAFESQHAIMNIEDQETELFDSVSILQEKIIVAKSERSDLQEVFSNDNARIKELSGRIAVLQRALVMNDVRQLSTYPGPSIREIPLLQPAYSDLVRRNEVFEDNVYDLSEMLEIAKIEEIGDTHNVTVLDKASATERKIFPIYGIIISVLAVFIEGCAILTIGRRWFYRSFGGKCEVKYPYNQPHGRTIPSGR